MQAERTSHPFRVFLSYCTEDRAVAEMIRNALVKLGCVVFWDRNISPGNPFTTEIKTLISRSHLFVAILTSTSNTRPWIHQETGYAMGVGIPILPLAEDDAIPIALIGELQAQRISPTHDDIESVVTRQLVESRVGTEYDYDPENYLVVESPEARAEFISNYAIDVLNLDGGHVRQKGSMTSFNLPTSKPDPTDPNDIWTTREGPMRRGHLLHKYQYRERKALGELAKKHGCSLIMRPIDEMSGYGDEALLIRQKQLRTFLTDERIDTRVVIAPNPTPVNVLIIGDWFYAESRNPTPGMGYQHTLISWHAPTVLRKMRDFDNDFETTREAQALVHSRLRSVAVEFLDQIIATTRARIGSSAGGTNQTTS